MTLPDPGTLWAAIGAIAVVVMGLYGVWAANPPKRLYYEATVTQTQVGTYRLSVVLRSNSRQDIGADLFDNQPFTVDAGATIKSTSLMVTCAPKNSTFHATTIVGSQLRIGPELIGRQQTITFTAELESTPLKPPEVTIKPHGVKVRPVPIRPVGRRWTMVWAGVTTMALVAAVTFGIIAFMPRTPVAGPAAPTSTKQISTPMSIGMPAIMTTPLAELNSTDAAVQKAGIQALQQIMQQNPADQPDVIQALCAFLRTASPTGQNDQDLSSVAQAAVTVVANRNTARDDGEALDLHNVNLSDASLLNGQFAGANFMNADFASADLTDATLQNANLYNAYVGYASLGGTNLTDANLQLASFYNTRLCSGLEPVNPQRGYNCTQ